jgi:DNA-binding transcriptional LysR family regulator
VIKKMHSVNPLIEVSVLIGGTDELLRKLNLKEIDFALLFNPPHRIATDALRLLKARPGLVMAANHPLALSKSLRLADCLQYGFILPHQSLGIREFIDKAFVELGVEFSGMVSTNSIALMKSMIKLGQNIAVLSIFDVYGELVRGELAFASIEDRNIEDEVLAICVPGNRNPSASAQMMIDLVDESLRSIREPSLDDSTP